MKKLLLFIILLFSYNMYAQQNEELEYAKQLLNNEKYVEALSAFNLYIEKNPTDYEAIAIRGKCNRKIGNYDAGFYDITNALKLNKNYTPGILELGKLYIMKESYTLALSYFNQLIEADSTFQDAYSSRGTLYAFYLNKDSLGLIDLNKAVQLDSTDASARYNRGNVYIDKNNYTAALNDLNYCITKKPTDHLALNSRGNCYYNIQKYDEAIKDYLQAVKYNTGINPHEFLNPGDIYFSIGASYANLKKNAKARYYFSKAQEYGVGPDSEKSNQTFTEHFKPTFRFNGYSGRKYYNFKSY